MKIIFICTANRDRSKTAEHYFSKEYPEHEFISAGINKYLSEREDISRTTKGQHLKKWMLDWADRIICAEYCHQQYIIDKIDKKYLDKIEVLLLEDTDTYMTEQLINKLKEKFKI